MLSACGPQVAADDDGSESDEDGSGDSSGGGSSSTPTASSSTGVADVATTDTPLPLDVGSTLPDLSGTHLFAVAAVIDPAHPFQWLATIGQAEQPGGTALKIQLQSLALDQGATTTPRTPVGESLAVDIVVDEEGLFAVEIPDVMISGAANPITGSDIVGSMVLEGQVIDDERWCGTVSGMITQPLMLDLSGSTFAGTRVADISQLPGDPIPKACP
jgi:hypothetical protein